jgi:anti-sigma regulatory factor (Ser/Thr protein kinase)
MHGNTSGARQISAGGRARYAGPVHHTTPPPVHDVPRDGEPRDGEPRNVVRIPSLAGGRGGKLADRRPLRSVLELGALPTAPGCARAWTRQILWEWQLARLSDTASLIVSELTTNGMLTSRQLGQHSIRLILTFDRGELAVLVRDFCPGTPQSRHADQDDEHGRGLLLVETMSDRSGWYQPDDGTPGKIVWAVVTALSPMAGFVSVQYAEPGIKRASSVAKEVTHMGCDSGTSGCRSSGAGSVLLDMPVVSRRVAVAAGLGAVLPGCSAWRRRGAVRNRTCPWCPNGHSDARLVQRPRAALGAETGQLIVARACPAMSAAPAPFRLGAN